MNAMKIDKDFIGDNTRDNRNKVTRADKIYAVFITAFLSAIFIGFAIIDFMG